MRYGEKWPIYASDWDCMVINHDRVAQFRAIAERLIASKSRYQTVEQSTGVPWYMIAVLHEREAAGDFRCYLGNGQRLNKRTTIVPIGRGPFANFEAGATDALRLEGFASVQDWRLEKILYHCELFNGTGYDNRNLPSPYIWGGTNIQKPGKYIADHAFDVTRMDPQPGCAPLLRTMMDLDPTITPDREQ